MKTVEQSTKREAIKQALRSFNTTHREIARQDFDQVHPFFALIAERANEYQPDQEVTASDIRYIWMSGRI